MALAGGALLLSGCSIEDLPWQPIDLPDDEPVAAIEEAPTPEPSSAPAEPVEVREASLVLLNNDLASGSAERSLTVGAVDLGVQYWSDLPMSKWTPEANKPLTVSVTGEPGALDSDVYLSQMTVTTTLVDAEGLPLPGRAEHRDSADVAPGFAIGRPYSYGATVFVPPTTSDAAAVELTFTWDVLTETAPDTEEYAKQSASDTITITFTEESP